MSNSRAVARVGDDNVQSQISADSSTAPSRYAAFARNDASYTGTTRAEADAMRLRLLLPILLVSCASTTTSVPKGGPRGLRANEHLESARQHDEAAASAKQWPDAYGDRAAYQIPWTRSWDTIAEQERSAAIHRSRAAELQAAYDDACGDRPLAQVSISPLHRYGIGGWNTTSGVILYLSPDAGAAEQLMADMRCHRAWMMLAPTNMEDCPLDLAGIQVDARGDGEGITVSITVRDPQLVDELHRRAAHELESSDATKTHHK